MVRCPLKCRPAGSAGEVEVKRLGLYEKTCEQALGNESSTLQLGASAADLGWGTNSI
jgi:hypothetical protein